MPLRTLPPWWEYPSLSHMETLHQGSVLREISVRSEPVTDLSSRRPLRQAFSAESSTPGIFFQLAFSSSAVILCISTLAVR